MGTAPQGCVRRPTQGRRIGGGSAASGGDWSGTPVAQRDAMQRVLVVAWVVVLAVFAGRLSVEPPAPAPLVLPPAVVHVHLPPAPALEPLPSPPLPGWPDRRHERFALSDAPGVLTAWNGVVAAPGAAVLAVWNSEAVLWSGDDGHTWTRHTLSDAQTVKLATAEGGWVYLLVSGRSQRGALWSFSPSGTRTTRPAPLAPADTEAFTAGFERIAVLGLRPTAAKARGAAATEADKEPVLRLSRDHGATWEDGPAPPQIGNTGNLLLLEADGALVHMLGQEASCGGGYQQRARLAAGASEWAPLAWPLDAPVRFWLGPAGWAYGTGDCRTSNETAPADGHVHLCAVGAGETALAGPELDALTPIDVTSNGRVTYAVAGRELFTVKGSAFRRVAADVPAAIETGARVDAGGRLLAIAAGRVVRWSAAGWEVLLPG
jgi:hypothetical protein